MPCYLALHFRHDDAYGLGGACGGGDDVGGGGSGPTNVAVDLVQDLLVVGVGVDGGHQGVTDAKVVVENLDQRRDAVGGT